MAIPYRSATVPSSVMTSNAAISGGLPANAVQNVGMKPVRPGTGSSRPMTRGSTPAQPKPSGGGFFNTVMSAIGGPANAAANAIGGAMGGAMTGTVARPGRPSGQTAQRPATPQAPAAPQSANINPQTMQTLAMLAAQQGNWQLAQQILTQQQRPQQQQQQGWRPPQSNYNQPAPWGGMANYASMMGIGAQNAQNNAMNSAVWQGNNTLVSGPLQSVSSPSGSIQNPGLYTSQMTGQGGGENMNRYFGNANTEAYSMGFAGMDDPRYTAWVQSGRQRPGTAASAGGGSTATVSTGGKDGVATGGTGTGTGTGTTGAETPQQQMLGQLFDSYQAQLDAANAAGLQRYGEGKGELTDLRTRGMNEINRVGSQQAQRIRRDATNARADARAEAVRRGMDNNPASSIAARGIEQDKNDQLRMLGDNVAQQRISTDNTLTNNLTNWIYNRNDNAPDFGQLIDLAKLYGESGYGQPMAQFPNYDLSGLGSWLNGLGNNLGAGLNAGLGNIGNQLASMLPNMGGGGYGSTGSGGGSMPAGSYGGGNVRPQTPHPQQTRPGTPSPMLGGLGSLAGLYGAQYLPQIGSAIGQGAGDLIQSPGGAIQNWAQGAGGLATGLGNGIASGLNWLGGGLNGIGDYLSQAVWNGIGNPSGSASGQTLIGGIGQGIGAANNWLSGLLGGDRVLQANQALGRQLGVM